MSTGARQGTARDRRRGPMQVPPAEIIELAPEPIREAFALYEQREATLVQARSEAAQAERAISRARYDTEARMEQAAREGTLFKQKDDQVREAEAAMNLARRRVTAAENVRDEARDRIIEVVQRDGRIWIAAVTAAISQPSIDRARELLASIEGVLPGTTAAHSLRGFVANVAGKATYAPRPLADAIVDGRGYVLGEMHSAEALHTLATLLRLAESALHEPDDGAERSEELTDEQPDEADASDRAGADGEPSEETSAGIAIEIR